MAQNRAKNSCEFEGEKCSYIDVREDLEPKATDFH